MAVNDPSGPGPEITIRIGAADLQRIILAAAYHGRHYHYGHGKDGADDERGAWTLQSAVRIQEAMESQEVGWVIDKEDLEYRGD